MFSSLFNSPVWKLIVMSDWISKWVVMFSLAIVSIICVAIIIMKAICFYKQKKALNQLLRNLASVNSLEALFALAKEFKNSSGGDFIIAAHHKLQAMKADKLSTITKEDVEILAFSLEQEISDLIKAEEDYLPFLGTSAAVGPLMGLFGTICGLIYAFMSISQEKSADIATVAPGIASALMTTLAGLVVAIPAMLAFHYFSHELIKRENNLYKINDLFILLIRKSSLL